MRRFTMTHRDELGNAIPMFDDAGQCEMNSGLQKAMNRLADLEDETQRIESRVVTDTDMGVFQELIDWYMDCDSNKTRLLAANQIIGALTLLMARWSNEEE